MTHSLKKSLRRSFAALAFLTAGAAFAQTTILNVSYDVSRELYKDINPAFRAAWKKQSGADVTVNQSHGGSSKQAGAVIGGLEADVITMNQSPDIDILVERGGLVAADWRKQFPHDATPYTTTTVFLVRKGNPKNIRDWGDLAKPGVGVITPNPKTSGGARWNYLAAWGWALRQPGGNEQKAKDLVTAIFKNVPVLDSGARGSTTTFVERGLGDVLIAWENEAQLAVNEIGKDRFEIVAPSLSILAEPPVAVVDKVVDKRGTRLTAQAYLDYLYSEEGQNIAAKHYYRPRDPKVAARYVTQFPKIRLITIDDTFGGWQKAQKAHFADGGSFDQIYLKK